MEILFEDNHILVAVKPPNMPVVSDSSLDMDFQSQLKGHIKKKHNKPGNVFLGIVHRLDRPVGGVMVFARTSKAASRLSEQVRNREFEKTYITVVHGTPKEKKGVLEDYLIKDEKTNTSYVSKSSEAKYSKLEYEVLKTNGEYSLLEINLHTGRHHQIRVQLSNMGHPIYADAKYSESKIKAPIALWAWKLAFNHPVTKEKMEFLKDPDYKGLPYSFFS